MVIISIANSQKVNILGITEGTFAFTVTVCQQDYGKTTILIFITFGGSV